MPINLDFNHIIEKIENNERFNFEEGCYMLRSAALPELKLAADHARKKRVGEKVYFIVNKHIYYSNICAWRCKFCAFPKTANDPKAYAKRPEEILSEIDTTPFVSEVRITGGVNPKLGVDYFREIFSLIRAKYPRIHIEALAPTEIDFIAKRDKLSPREVLVMFKNAGLGSLAAGGAEISSERVRKELCPNKSPFSTWLEVSKIAHKLGIKSNASILYGHIETIEERVAHILRIRELQDETGGYNAFIPLKFIPNAVSDIKSSILDDSDDLKMFALSRLLLDNFDHLKVLWLFNEKDFVKSALDFGANDIGGTVYEQNKGVARSACSDTEHCFTKADMIQLINECGRKPAERGKLYNEITQLATT